MKNKKFNTIFISILLIVGVYYFFLRQDVYIGFYYPNENNLTEHIQSQEFDSLEECRGWVERQTIRYNPLGYGYDYECGKNCKAPDYPDGLYVCEETLE